MKNRFVNLCFVFVKTFCIAAVVFSFLLLSSCGQSKTYSDGMTEGFEKGYAQGYSDAYGKETAAQENKKTDPKAALEDLAQRYDFTLTPHELPSNGFIIYPTIKGYSSESCGLLTVVASVSESYYIKLRDRETGDLVLSFFVRAGMTVDVNVPYGEYELSYACGESWYGYNFLFGADTSYARADDTFIFEDYGDSYTWWTVELYRQYGGNLDTEPIDSDEF